jgi:DNA-binding CsgD family transcriptional regulator
MHHCGVNAGGRPSIKATDPCREETAMANPTILSGREREVLALVAEDLTNKQIAQRLRISSNTVQGYVSLALNKSDRQ